MNNSVESRGPSPCTSGAPLLAPLRRSPPSSLTSSDRNIAGGRITNTVDTVSQVSRPTRYNYNGLCKIRQVMWVFLNSLNYLGITESNRDSRLTNLRTSQSTYAHHRVILLSTWVFEHLEMCIIFLGVLLDLSHLHMTGWAKYI
jgi:hypothetical protein